MRIIAVRHGETTHNANRIIMGHRHGKLSSTGKKQAKAVGQFLKKEKIDFVYCSDLKRCKETLKEISKHHQHIPVVFTKELRERSFGVYEGVAIEKLDKLFGDYKGRSIHFKPPQGESVHEQRNRIRKFINYLEKKHPKDRVLLVTHGGVLRVAASILQKISIPKLFKTVNFHNTAISEYEIVGSKVIVHRFNEIKHL